MILDAIQDGAARLTWKQDTFAYADSYDAVAGRYRGLEADRRPNVQLNSDSVVVKPEVAAEQREKEAAQASTAARTGGAGTRTAETAGSDTGAIGSPAIGVGVPRTSSTKAPNLRRFHGSATLNALDCRGTLMR